MVQTPKRLRKGRCRMMSGGMVILDGLLMAIFGFGLAAILVALSVLTAMV